MTNLLELTTSNLDLGQILTKSAEIAANHVSGAALGGFLFSIPGAVMGTKEAINSLDLNKKPNSPYEALEELFKIMVLAPAIIPCGACMGASIAAAPGAAIGGVLGKERAVNLLNTSFNGIIGAVYNLASPAKSLASSAITTTYNEAISHPIALGVASTAVITSAMAYKLYTNYAQETKNKSKLSPSSLQQQEKELDNKARNIQTELSLGIAGNKDLDQTNKMMEEYYKKQEINLETVLQLQETYKNSMQHLAKDKLEEMSELSIKLLKSIGKCQELRQNHTLKEKESFAAREQNKKNSKQIRQH